jgi:alpha-ketoglutarate-dependent taurine dioxygenase
MNIKYPLTASGIGVLVENADSTFFEKAHIENLLYKHQFLICKQINWSIDQLHTFLEQFGELVKNEKRKDNTVLELNGRDKEVLKGNGRMPLHRDGLLMNNAVKYTAIYCLEFDVTKGGRTYISDNEAAWSEFPETIKEILHKNGFEVKPYDKNYYLKNEDKWYPFEGVAHFEGKAFLNGGLNYAREEDKSYELRICNINEEQSYRYYGEMEAILENEKYTYFHDWNVGDLIFFDNRRVLHGREAFEGIRSLIQLQVKE